MKWFKRVLFAVLGTLLVLGGLGLYLNYVENNTFRAVDSIDGISLGQSREDLLFLRGLNLACTDPEISPSKCDLLYKGSEYDPISLQGRGGDCDYRNRNGGLRTGSSCKSRESLWFSVVKDQRYRGSSPTLRGTEHLQHLDRL